MPSAPLIGVIATRYDTGENQRPFTGAYPSYLESVIAGGGLPVIVPLELPEAMLYKLYRRLDGVVFTGGGDVNPALYGGDAAHESLRGVIDLRDVVEQKVARWAAEDDLPTLGICRGHQLVNVALGGKLLIDIPSQHSTPLKHDYDSDVPLDHIAHTLSVEPDSLLAKVIGSAEVAVNSRHHQYVVQPGAGMIVSACAPDGIPEASELPGARFFVTVQWHPENLLEKEDGVTVALFTALAEAARHA